MNRGLPTGWSETTLSEVSAVNPRSFDLAPDADDLVSFVPMAAVEEESGRMDATQHRPWRDVQKGYTRFQEGDVVFAKITPCMENGKFALATGLHGGRAAGTTELHVLRPAKALSARFLLHFLLQESIRSTAQRAMRGAAGQLRVPPEFLRDLILPLPPVAEQHRIVAAIEEHLTKLDAAVAALERARANCQRRTAASLGAAFESAVRGGHVATLGDLAWDSSYGTSVRCEYDAGGPAVLRIPNIQGGRIELSDLKHAITAVGEDDDALKPGDMLIVRTNGSRDLIGRGAVVDEPFGTPTFFASYLIRFRLKGTSSDLRWTSLMWRSPQVRGILEDLAASSAGQFNLSLGKLSPVRIPFPRSQHLDRCLQELEAQLVASERARAAIELQLSRAARMRQAILTRAFEGKLVPQDPSDEPASAFLDRIRTASAVSAASRPSRTRAAAVRSRSVRR